MATTTTTTPSLAEQRAELANRLAGIERRLSARADEIAAIEGRQVTAATAGDEPDPALVTAKAALADAQGIDQRAAAAVRGQLDQVDAQLARETALRDLARLRRQAAQTAAEAREAAEGYPAAQEAALAAVRALTHGLRGHAEKVRTLTAQAVQQAEAITVVAQRLDQPIGHNAVPNHDELISRRYPISTHLPDARVYAATRRSVVDLATELVAAAFHGEVTAGPDHPFSIG